MSGSSPECPSSSESYYRVRDTMVIARITRLSSNFPSSCPPLSVMFGMSILVVLEEKGGTWTLAIEEEKVYTSRQKLYRSTESIHN